MPNNNNHSHHAPREYFTLGEHDTGVRHYRFRYDGRTYLILERPVVDNPTEGEEPEEKVLLEESDSRTAYDAWNRIKRPERFGL